MFTIKNNIKIVAAALLATVSMAATGAPALRRPVTVTQPDGSTIEIVMYGDEHFSYATDTDGRLLTQDAAGFWTEAPEGYEATLQQRRKEAAAAPRRILNDGDVPTTGTLRGLVILAEYSDFPFSGNNDRARFERLLNEEGYNADGATGSVRDYYVDQSYGKFTPEFDVVGPVKLPNTLAYYGADTNGAQDPNAYRMIVDACRLADEQFDVNFADYDNNGDGLVDLVYVIYSGYAQSNGASTYTIWPHMWFLSQYGAALSVDGVAVDRYACSSERMGTSGDAITGIGLICHEFSHTLGLPDIYATSGSLQKIAMGDFDVMDSGCYNNMMRTPAGYSSFEKSSLGWLDPVELEGQLEDVCLAPLSSGENSFIITSAADPDEFYLLETRTRSDKWDRYLPGEGLLAVYVNYDADIWDRNKVNSDGNWRVHLVPSSGDFSKNTDMTAVAFPGSLGVNVWGDRTDPSMRFSDGEAVGKPLTDIRYDGTNTYFDFGMNMPAPVLTAPSDITETGFRAHWTAVEDAESYLVSISSQATGKATVYEKVMRDYYTFSRLDPEDTYTYRVKAVGSVLESPWSEPLGICLAEEIHGGAGMIPEDDAAAGGVIYSLDGVCRGTSVSGLRPGVYIRRTATETTKIIVSQQ